MGKPKRSIRSLVGSTLLFVLFFLLIHSTIQNFHIDGHSMEPTFHDQEYVIVDKAAYLFQPPARGDVIVFQYPYDTSKNYVKRIIAVPGDIVSVISQVVTVDGVTLQEPYINTKTSNYPYQPVVKQIVGPDQYFVLGDNRGDSSDSREWGLLPRQNIIGKAALVYWPLGTDNFGFVQDSSSVFAKVHQ